MKKQRGFTLIELLVVIAIIGILSAVVLASLNTARSKGNDVAVKADLSNIRTQAEIRYGLNGNSYNTGLAIASADCSTLTTAGSLMADTIIQNSLKAAKNAMGGGATAASDCGITNQAYSFAAPMTSGAWCIDSSGISRSINNANAAYTGVASGAAPAHTASGQTTCN
jgi:prepilin-type N-terminal cleavage/methylation domain-containing protein